MNINLNDNAWSAIVIVAIMSFLAVASWSDRDRHKKPTDALAICVDRCWTNTCMAQCASLLKGH